MREITHNHIRGRAERERHQKFVDRRGAASSKKKGQLSQLSLVNGTITLGRVTQLPVGCQLLC